MRTPAALLIALSLPVATAPAPAVAQVRSTVTVLDPTGTYDLDVEMHGQMRSVTLTVVRETDGRLTATLEAPDHAISFDRGTLEDRELTLLAGSDLTLSLTFTTDDRVTGKWTHADASGSVTGIRRKN